MLAPRPPLDLEAEIGRDQLDAELLKRPAQRVEIGLMPMSTLPPAFGVCQ